jgi:hypothetical protein
MPFKILQRDQKKHCGQKLVIFTAKLPDSPIMSKQANN